MRYAWKTRKYVVRVRRGSDQMSIEQLVKRDRSNKYVRTGLTYTTQTQMVRSSKFLVSCTTCQEDRNLLWTWLSMTANNRKI